MKGFGDLGPPHNVNDPTSSVYNGVEYATKELIRIATESPVKSKKKVIVIKCLEEYVEIFELNNFDPLNQSKQFFNFLNVFSTIPTKSIRLQ